MSQRGRNALRTSNRFRAAIFALAIGCLALAALAQAEVVQRGKLRVSFEGKIAPHHLPRNGTAPVEVTVGTKVSSTNGQNPPQLRRIVIAFNHDGRFESKGLPVCPLRAIQPASTADALAACPGAVVGSGQFSSSQAFGQQAPFPSTGKVYAFNSLIGCSPSERNLRTLLWLQRRSSRSSASESRSAQRQSKSSNRPGRLWPSSSRTQGARGGERAPARDPSPSDRGQRAAPCHSRPAILAHVYGTDPVPTSYTIPFVMSRAKGAFGTVLTASFPQATGSSGYITGLRLTLGRTFALHGHRHSYLSAGCPAPQGISRALFPLARASVYFAKGKPVSEVLRRPCTALG